MFLHRDIGVAGFREASTQKLHKAGSIKKQFCM